MNTIKIQPPLRDEEVSLLKIGTKVLITGTIYTARDAAHQKLVTLLKEGKPLPFDLQGQIIYYVGPAPAKPGQIIGSAGPTTSSRMDVYTPALLKAGLKGMIGKGMRADYVREAIKEYKAVYMAALGGAAVLMAKSIKKVEVLAYPELGTEAIHRLEVQDLPAIVVNDCFGGDLYLEGVKKYCSLK